MLHAVTLGLSLVLSSAPAAVAADPGKAAGTVTINGVTTNLTVAIETTAENLFDDKKKDTIITLADKPLGETSAGHDIELSMRARKGDLTVLMLRLDGTKLVNVSVMHKGLSGVDKLPGQWFQYTPLSGKAGGMLKLAKRDFDGKSYACDVQFTAAPAPKKAEAAPEPAPASASVAKPAPKPEPAPKPAALATDNNAATKRFVAAMMSKDERQALEIVKSGIDPNSMDSTGIPILNWSVMMCMPSVVKALVDRKANLKYERAPGLTVMQEAGACPAAAKILKAAGAR